MAAAGGHGNGGTLREQVAVLNTKMDQLLNNQVDLKKCVEGYGGRISELEIGQATRKGQISTLQDDVKVLEAKSERWSVLNSVGTFIAFVMAGIGLGKS